MDQNRTEIKLSSPITVDGVAVDVLHLRKPKARDLRGARIGDGEMSMMLDVAAACAEIPPSAIDQLECADAMRVISVVADFFGSSLPEDGVP